MLWYHANKNDKRELDERARPKTPLYLKTPNGGGIFIQLHCDFWWHFRLSVAVDCLFIYLFYKFHPFSQQHNKLEYNVPLNNAIAVNWVQVPDTTGQRGVLSTLSTVWAPGFQRLFGVRLLRTCALSHRDKKGDNYGTSIVLFKINFWFSNFIQI